jgi:hypothetical protein
MDTDNFSVVSGVTSLFDSAVKEFKPDVICWAANATLRAVAMVASSVLLVNPPEPESCKDFSEDRL